MSGEQIVGIVRVDENVTRLAARLGPGEIAVVDQPDIDRASAVVLLAKHPRAVLNASSSTTGRSPSVGAQLLVSEGVPLLDSLGPDVMVLREGERIEVLGNQVIRGGQLIAEGQLRDARELNQQHQSSRGRLGIQVQAFAQGAQTLWEREHSVLLDGAGVPRFPDFRKSRAAVIVAPGAQNLRRLRGAASDLDAIIIGVEGGAEKARQLGRGLDIFVGDPSGVSEKTLRKASHRVLLQRISGDIVGRERTDSLGLAVSVMQTSAGAPDAAVLLADVNGAPEIVLAGPDQNLEDFFDLPAPEQLAGFFVRMRAQSKMVAASVAERLYRPRVSMFWLVLMMIAALVILGVSVWMTPWGQSLARPISEWIESWWPWGTGTGGTA